MRSIAPHGNAVKSKVQVFGRILRMDTYETMPSRAKAMPSITYGLTRKPESRYDGAVTNTLGEKLAQYIVEVGLVRDGRANQLAFAKMAGADVSKVNQHIRGHRKFAKPETIAKWVDGLNRAAEANQVERRFTEADFLVERRSVPSPHMLETTGEAKDCLTSGKIVAHQGKSLAKSVANIPEQSYSDASTSSRERRVLDAQNDRRALVSLDAASVSNPGRFASRLSKIHKELRAAAEHVGRAALEFTKEARARELHRQAAGHTADRSGRHLPVPVHRGRRNRRNAG